MLSTTAILSWFKDKEGSNQACDRKTKLFQHGNLIFNVFGSEMFLQTEVKKRV